MDNVADLIYEKLIVAYPTLTHIGDMLAAHRADVPGLLPVGDAALTFWTAY